MTEELATGAQESAVADMKSLMLEITQALVDVPEAVSVEAYQDGAATVLRLRVSGSDLGKVIGKQGRTARSLRTILGAASMKLKHRFALDIVEIESGNPSVTDNEQGDSDDSYPADEPRD